MLYKYKKLLTDEELINRLIEALARDAARYEFRQRLKQSERGTDHDEDDKEK
jgi:hypothetical protein